MVSSRVNKIVKDIRTMQIRGAGRIARAAANALKIASKESKAETLRRFSDEMGQVSKLLLNTRPTAVSLPNAIRYVTLALKQGQSSDLLDLKKAVQSRAGDFIKNSNDAVRKIGEIGTNMISDNDTILTHCNSQSALSVIKTAFRRGKNIKVYVTESRPLWQGRLSARDLLKEGIPTTMIIDSAVRHFMRDMDKVVVGADSIAANGAVVNKIGTSAISLAAHDARVLFFVAAETYKFHPETLVGRLIEIEERDPSEIINLERYPKLKVNNPSFDVTPPEHVDLIITERGIISPYSAYSIIQDIFNWKTSEGIQTLK